MSWLLFKLWPKAFGAFLWAQTNQPRIKYYNLKDPDPEPSLAWFVLNAFAFVGVTIAIVVGLGIAFGSFRLWLLAKFPNNRFNGTEDEDVSQTFRLNDPPEA
jgi:hypothetical protein